MVAILSPSGFLQSTADEDAEGGGELGIVLERTPFYAEQGGQVADQGKIESASASFAVHDTRVGPLPDRMLDPCEWHVVWRCVGRCSAAEALYPCRCVLLSE